MIWIRASSAAIKWFLTYTMKEGKLCQVIIVSCHFHLHALEYNGFQSFTGPNLAPPLIFCTVFSMVGALSKQLHSWSRFPGFNQKVPCTCPELTESFTVSISTLLSAHINSLQLYLSGILSTFSLHYVFPSYKSVFSPIPVAVGLLLALCLIPEMFQYIKFASLSVSEHCSCVESYTNVQIGSYPDLLEHTKLNGRLLLLFKELYCKLPRKLYLTSIID